MGARLGLPPLPTSRVILLSRVSEPGQQAALRTLIAALRARAST